MPQTTLARRQLGRRLRRLREQAGKTLADVEAAGVGGPTKLWRIETGKSSVRTGDVRDLCALYGVGGDVLERLLGLARATKGQGWWEDYALAFGQFGLYLELEAAADRLKVYDPEVIHGLLQVPEYHQALSRASGPVTEAEMQQYMELLRARQRAALGRSHSCQVTAIVGEAALTRIIGSTDTMTAQRQRLSELVAQGGISVRVFPWEGGAHAGLDGGAFTLLEFDDPDDPDVVYMQSRIDARFLEREPELVAYREAWATMTRQSVPLEEYSR